MRKSFVFSENIAQKPQKTSGQCFVIAAEIDLCIGFLPKIVMVT